jgi:hypothetical protein
VSDWEAHLFRNSNGLPSRPTALMLVFLCCAANATLLQDVAASYNTTRYKSSTCAAGERVSGGVCKAESRAASAAAAHRTPST